MERHWQREPRLVRAAFPGFRDPLSPREVMALASAEEISSRLVQRRGKRWSLEHGPIDPARFAALPPRDWTVLVQDTNHVSAAADRLLREFDFIPHARIDDVMVSYARRGGGVGPHVDSYDVFLLQGRGRRRWRISRQRDLAFVPGLPLKILARFEPEEEWVLEAGDMLYLPPGVAHDGIAEDDCLTWSIGFRAPSDEELAHGFLDHLRDTLRLAGHYGDAGAEPAPHPGEIPGALLEHAREALARIDWSDAGVRDFTGRFLSEPKAHVVFEPPRRPLSRATFQQRAARSGIALDRRSRLLFSGRMFFMNGEKATVPAAARAMMRKLADERRLLPPVKAPAAFWDLMYGWYLLGFASTSAEDGP